MTLVGLGKANSTDGQIPLHYDQLIARWVPWLPSEERVFCGAGSEAGDFGCFFWRLDLLGGTFLDSFHVFFHVFQFVFCCSRLSEVGTSGAKGPRPLEGQRKKSTLRGLCVTLL